MKGIDEQSALILRGFKAVDWFIQEMECTEDKNIKKG